MLRIHTMLLVSRERRGRRTGCDGEMSTAFRVGGVQSLLPHFHCTSLCLTSRQTENPPFTHLTESVPTLVVKKHGLPRGGEEAVPEDVVDVQGGGASGEP